MEILVDKVKYEQKIRILEERDKIREQKDKEKDEQIKQLREEMDALKKAIAHAPNQQNPQTINNNNTNNFNAPINITINNYLKPNISYLAVDDLFKNTFKENLVQTPMAIIPLIWFNPEHPENFSIYLVNKSTKETLTYTGNKWDVTTADKVTKDVRDRAYAITNGILGNPNLKVLTPYTQNIPAAIAANTTDEELIKAECEKIYNQFMQNRKLIKPYTQP
jgi:Spy/CpxP family protein refolding chaperone